MKDICYITMATTGNAVGFGELTLQDSDGNCMSSQTKSDKLGVCM